MNTVGDAVDTMIHAIQDSEQYKDYIRQRETVNLFPELRDQIDEYRKTCYELQNSDDYTFEKMEQFEQENAEFRENPLVSDFLGAELDFCRMMQEILKRITTSINYE